MDGVVAIFATRYRSSFGIKNMAVPKKPCQIHPRKEIKNKPKQLFRYDAENVEAEECGSGRSFVCLMCLQEDGGHPQGSRPGQKAFDEAPLLPVIR